jgi:hypothetical protein
LRGLKPSYQREELFSLTSCLLPPALCLSWVTKAGKINHGVRCASSGKQVKLLADEYIKNLLEWSVDYDISNDSTNKAFN